MTVTNQIKIQLTGNFYWQKWLFFFNLNITGIYENCVTKNGNKFKKKEECIKNILFYGNN